MLKKGDQFQMFQFQLVNSQLSSSGKGCMCMHPSKISEWRILTSLAYESRAGLLIKLTE